MGEIAAPHDRFFRTLLARPGVADALLRERLPSVVTASLADAPVEAVWRPCAIMRTYRGTDRSAVRELVRRVRPGEEEAVMSMFAEELLREGEARGKAEGKAETLLRLLRRRFGTVPEAVTTRVQAATTDELDQWLDNFVDAQALDDVFAEPRAH